MSTYVPRRCGLATYTADLREALALATGDITPVVVAIDRDGLKYDDVVAVIDQDQISDYESAADDIAAAGVDVVLIQHEYGIFGGPNGSYVLHLARALTRRGIPYLVTLHTLLSQPTAGQAATLAALCAGAARVTVFTETARTMAVRAGVASADQIVVVPHGAPEILRTVPPADALRPELSRLLASLGDDPVLATFGLVSAGKGLEDAVAALAQVVRHHPGTRYVIAGATHPEIVRNEGESYRERLHSLVAELGLTANVHLIDSFLTPAELSALLRRTTIFVTPYRSPEQICSGALTFAIAAGCPVVSTSYRYAEDLLATGAGVLVPCHDVAAIADGIVGLLDDPDRLATARAAADTRGSALVWPAVALTAATLIRRVATPAPAGSNGRVALPLVPVPALPPVPVPALRLDHLVRLTDEIGIIEFCRGREPDLGYGYNVDDVSRVALVAAQLRAVGQDRGADGRRSARWIGQSLRFITAALGPDGRMHNRMTYGGSWSDRPHGGDHVARTMWALGVVTCTGAVPVDLRRTSAGLLAGLAPHAPTLAAAGLRSTAYALLGLVHAQRDGRTAAAGPELARLVEVLDTALREHAEPGWYWFEPELTYDNTRLAQALLAGAELLGDRIVAARALTALDWFADHVGLTGGMLRNVGNRWHRHDDPAGWHDDGDEQPIDAASAVEAMVQAWRYTGDARYGSQAAVAYSWFHGNNRIRTRLYDPESGGCHDGLTPHGVNPNQGAESTLAHLQALLCLVGAGLAALPDRVPVEPAATARGARVKLERRGTVRAPERAEPTHRTRTAEGRNDAR